MKKKLDASKARNKYLSTEIKTLKSQISDLLVKSKHDDELVDALLVSPFGIFLLFYQKILLSQKCVSLIWQALNTVGLLCCSL